MSARVSRGASSSPLTSTGAMSNNSTSSSPLHAPTDVTFGKVFDTWLVEQDRRLQELISAADGRSDETEFLRSLLDRVMGDYEDYYRAKSAWAQQDVLAMLSPSWTSSLEDAFLWIGGWRPSMAYHVIYSKSGLQLETRIHDLIRGIPTDDLADLSGEQLRLVDELQRLTIGEEREITEEMAKVQESAADSSMVDLSHVVSEMIRAGGEISGEGVDERVNSTLVAKEEQMEELLHAADDLRLRTLRAIAFDVLTPIQAVHFFIAVAELHLRVHDWGMRRDAGDTSPPPST